MVMDVVTAAGPSSAGSGIGAVLAYSGVVLLAALLPFVLSFLGDAVASLLRRGRAALSFLVTVVVAGLVLAGIGVLLLQLGLGLVDGGDAELADRLSGLARGLLLVCAPLAVLALALRLALARTRARRTPPDAGTDDAGADRH